MLRGIQAFGWIGAAGVGALVFHHGYTSAGESSGAIMAFLFLFIAGGAIIGPAAVVWLLRNLPGFWKLWSLAVLVGVCIAILGHGINSLDALMTRMDRTEAERAGNSTRVGDERAALKRILDERQAMEFVSTTEDGVKAARAAVAAAERATGAECDKRGPQCRSREAEERERRAELATALRNRGLTERAERLDTAAAEARRRLALAPPVVSTNPWAEAASRLLHIPPADAVTLRLFYMASTVEILIALALLVSEMMPAPKLPADAGELREAPSSGAKALSKAQEAISTRPDAAPAPPDRAHIGRFMLQCLPRAAGEAAGGREIFERYKVWCGAETPPVTPWAADAFAAEFGARCKKYGIGIEKREGRVFFVNVRLAA